MKDIDFKYCSKFKHVDCYHIREVCKNGMTVFFHVKNGTEKSVFIICIYKTNGKFEFSLIASNVSAELDYCFEYRFRNDINALVIFNDLCRDSNFESKVKSLKNFQYISNGFEVKNKKESSVAVIEKYIYPLSKEAILQDVLNVLPKKIRGYNEFYMNDSYIGYRGNLEIKEPIYFEGGEVFAAQRLLILLIRNSLV